MKRLYSTLLMGFCSILATSAMLFGQEATTESKQSTLRNNPEQLKQLHVAHEIDRKRMAAEEGIVKTGEETVLVKQDEASENATAAQKQQFSTKSLNKQLKATSSDLFYTSHEGVFQYPVSISGYGDIMFEDGSMWFVKPSEAHRVQKWLGISPVGEVISYPIVVSINHSLFSSYNFKLTNQTTGVSVCANLSLKPDYYNQNTHWIAAIDYYYNIVYLEDGTVWHMSSFDSGIVNEWLVNDTVIIGINDSWGSSSNPNILINANLLTSYGILSYAAGLATY